MSLRFFIFTNVLVTIETYMCLDDCSAIIVFITGQWLVISQVCMCHIDF